MFKYRTHTCGELTEANIGEEVLLCGWLKDVRNLGQFLFFTLRDHYGITQFVVTDADIMQKVLEIPRESTLSVKGTVHKRQDVNPSLPTGYIEIVPTEITLLGKCQNVLPFEIMVSTETREDLRLKYRYLDLRNDKVHKNIVFRSKVIQSIRNRMIDEGFMEIQTPILTSTSPEGARDYVVPSRVHPGKFYALPQAPQQFKQLLMVSGFDRYFQVAPCFRDEDARADRSPGEFYQLDIEMAFATQEDVFAVLEKVLYGLFTEFSEYEICKPPFTRIPYREAMSKYGSDKPDLRNPLIIQNVASVVSSLEFKPFSEQNVLAIVVPNSASQPRSFFDKLCASVTEAGAKSIAWLKVGEDLALSGGVSKFILEPQKSELLSALNCSANSSIFFISGGAEAVKAAGFARTAIAEKLDIIEKDVFKFCWIVDFPMFEFDEENNKVEFSHNPFSMPQGGLEALNEKDPLDILAYQYDIVCNGIELSSGAVRNHRPDIMLKAFDIAGYSSDVVESKFPALFNAFQYGAPPHAGIAPGVDRIVMLLANEPNIREVIAFPMNKQAQDILMGAPSEITEKQLSEVHIKIDVVEKEETV